jgi:peptide/nickel transport system substrate-binding protein
MTIWKRAAAVGMTLAMSVGALAACGSNGSNSGGGTTAAPSESAVTSTESAETPSTQVVEDAATGEQTLVVGMDQFSSKFSPFFAKTAYDTKVSSMTQEGALASDRGGNMVLNSIEGETIPYNGTDYTYTGIGDCAITINDDGTVTYDVTLRDDIVFSDGVPMTIDDYIFNCYVYCDPTYDGSSSMYAFPILGVEEYRSGMSTLRSLLIKAGRDNTDFTNFTQEQQDSFWGAVDKAGPMFAQDIIDYCVAAYPDEVANMGNSEVALGMVMWGFGELNDDATVLTAAGTGTEYNVADLTPEIYWSEMEAKYGGDLQTLSDTETANTDLFTYMTEVYGDATAAEFDKAVATGDTVDYIPGIEKTGDYSARITMSSFSANAIYTIGGIEVAPMHYYGDATQYDYDNHKFGFPKGDLSMIRDKTTKPLGAGPYVFESYENGVVTFTANSNYYEGEPKIKTLLFKETPASDKLSGVVSGSFDITDPTMSVDVLSAVKGYNSNGEASGDVLTTTLVDTLGYGYIGINADNVKVGSDPGSDASKDLRKAFATLFAYYRDIAANSFYGEIASVINYPISNTSWAAVRPADEGYQVAYSKDVDGNGIYTDSMTQDEKHQAAIDTAIGYFKAAGYTYDEASGKFTAAPEGAEMVYEALYPGGGSGDHPVASILTNSKTDLEAMGITLELNDPADSNVLWTKLESGTQQIWAAAWSATADPDMYQLYHSDNNVGAGGTESNHYGIKDARLDELIMDGRNSADVTYRKSVYKEAMDIVLDWGVEIPFYQRKDGFVFSTERVNVDTITPDITPFWSWTAGITTLEMN